MFREEILEKIEKGIDPFPEIVGQADTKKGVVGAIVSGRHIVIVGPPGTGKTTLAKNIADLLPEIEVAKGCQYNCDPENPVCPYCKANKDKLDVTKSKGSERFVRIQGSPDLQAEDLLGDINPVKALEFGADDPRAFTPGKLLRANRGVLFFDEINRCPERLQNALLQVLEEGIATIGGYSVDYPADFILIATMNPSEFVGTERMSEVLMDRFDMTNMGYPETAAIEKQIARSKGMKLRDVPEKVLDFIVEVVRNTRLDNRIERPAGMRATIGLYDRSQAEAILNKRKKVAKDDVVNVIHGVLDHRIKLKSRVKHLTTPEKVIQDIISGKIERAPKGGSSYSRNQYFSGERDLVRDKKDTEILDQMVNKSVAITDPVHTAKMILNDVNSAQRELGKEFLENLTGFGARELRTMQRRFKYRATVAARINEKMRKLRRKGLIDSKGQVTEKGIELLALHSFMDELDILGKFGTGEHEGREKGGHGEIIGIRPYHSGDTFRSIDLRATINVAARRKHGKIDKRDLRTRIRSKTVSIDFAYVLDSSGSMRGAKMSAVKKAAIALSYLGVEEGDRVSVVSFSKQAETVVPLTSDIMEVARAVTPITPGRGTDLAEALRSARGSLEESKREKHIILISDAVPTEGDEPIRKALEEASVCRADKISVSVIGIGLDDFGKENAQQIAGIGDGVYYHIDDPENIHQIIISERQRIKDEQML